MTKDLDRNIYTIRYNSLNLPDTIQFKNGNQIVNKYDAGGRKLSTLYYTLQYILPVPLTEGEVLELYYSMDIIDETGTFYVDNIEYDFNGCDPGVYMLRNVYNPEGYANQLYVTGGPNYQYYRKDHLGNNREVWCANTNTTLQRTHYYPSGLPWRTTTGIGADVQNRKYNGKEFVEMHGLDEYDSEARWFYPAIVRTTTMDPLAEKFFDISPYAWCGNNPVLQVDPDGRAFETAWDLYSLYTGAKSFVDNVRQGNVGAAILDGVGVIADAAAVVVPGVPGGVGAGIKAVRTADNLVDAAKTGKAAEKVVEGAKAKNLKDAAEKGIPQSQLGPSGKPKVHTASKPNLKQAEEAARNNPKSNTSPVKHSSDKSQKTHYHSTKNGEKMTGKDNVLYENRSSKKNPN